MDPAQDLMGAVKRFNEALNLAPHKPFFIARVKIKLALHKTKKMINSILHGGQKKDTDPSKPYNR
jgi:hypothetical protein